MAHGGFATLLVDIGGVLLTPSWDRRVRLRACRQFGLDIQEVEARHELTYDIFEAGKITFGQYLHRVVFHQKRHFDPEEFKQFVLDQSKPCSEMFELVRALKHEYGLRVVAVSNDGRELATHRIQAFNLRELIDTFVISSFVNVRKPDEEIYRIALDLVQASARETLYIEAEAMFIQVAQPLGIRGICHGNFPTTSRILAEMGFPAHVPVH